MNPIERVRVAVRFMSGGISLLALKSILVALVWFFFPLWVFIIIALYFYAVPPFRALSFLWPLAALFIGAALLPDHIISAFFVGASFLLTLGIKDLLFVDRRAAHETLVLLSAFAGILYASAYFPESKYIVLEWSIVAFIFFMLVRGLFRDEYIKGAPSGDNRIAQTITILLTLVFWEGGIVVFYLPINFLYQTAILFVLVATLVGVATDYFCGMLSKERALIYGSFFFTIITIALTAVSWGV